MTAGGKVQPGLHFVATPIGSARDITLRALDVLKDADVIAAEDTRTARRLMEIHGIPVAGRQMIAYHDHSSAQGRAGLLKLLQAGKSMAYVSEAGTPLVADPGYQLGRAAIEEGIAVYSAPGASAALAALSVSGLASDRFLFAGFPPPQAGARRKWLADLDAAKATVILYESPKRVYRTLAELCEVLGDDREVALCRELTKRFEEVLRGTCGQVRDRLAEQPVKGEIVLVIGRGTGPVATEADVEAALRTAMADLPLKQAAAQVAEVLNLSKRDLYQLGLKLKNDG
ncbi:16S rRNA (cytidine(1402)-2'-O)-methyltransferase [Gymnodinialimonas hymeniacidonis]|uniref:16S rRNA (cytidine(1402)-2'-O)-methyltransferase n=1 Tax=Gymnodinialimonas hymeniacidonis TaxID=3126508 RepID=UPI0034C69756